MSGKELLTHLRRYKKYENETDYYIKKAIGGKKQATVDELKKELMILSTQHVIKQNIKSYVIKNKSYTEDDLIKMIEFYENHNVKLVELPKDNLYEIMLNSDLHTIINYCQTNKDSIKLCHDNQFWIKKI